MNEDHLPGDELLPELDWTIQRQYELFRERSKLTGRLVVLTLVISTFVLFTVVQPFGDMTAEARLQSEALAVVDATRAEVALKYEQQTELLEHLAGIRKAIDARPWSGQVDELVRSIRTLNTSYQVLINATRDDLEDSQALLDHTIKADAVPAAFQHPGSTAEFGSRQSSETDATSDAADASAVHDRALLDAFEQYFAAVERLREIGFHQPDAANGIDAAPTSETTQEPSWKSTPPPTIAEALEAMQVEPTEIFSILSFRDRDEFLFGRLETRVQEVADEAIESIAATFRTTVLAPLETVVADEHTNASQEY